MLKSGCKFLICLIFLLFVPHRINGNGDNDEILLRNSIFKEYNKYVRPTKYFNNTLNVYIGIGVQNIESFDQIQETIQLNVWLRKYWTNSLLNWDSSLSNISQITLTKKDVWTPDIELINAATLPDIYTLNGGMYLYPNGDMIWSIPAVYKFSCPLNLKFFPFDTQICSMQFSSWSFDNSLLTLSPYGDTSTQIDVLDSCSHSEWKLMDYNIETYNETRRCCPNKLFSVNKYNFELKRYTHYYILNMGMTISLVIVSFIIMMVSPDNLSRTGTAVFIPLTILALELTIAGKIPIVGYYTLMDIFFLTCFITSMMVSIESGIVYIMITSKSGVLYSIFERTLNLKSIVKKYKANLKFKKDKNNRHKNELDSINNVDIQLENLGTLNNKDNEGENEFKALEEVLYRQNSYHEAMDNKHNINTKITEIDSKTETDIDTDTESLQHNPEDLNEMNEMNEMMVFNDVVDKHVVRTIDYNNKNLSLTFKEYLIFSEITAITIKIDNSCRILLPVIFFTIIIIIFSYN